MLVVAVSCRNILVVAVSCRSTLVVVVVSCRSTLVVVGVVTCRHILDALRALEEAVTCNNMVVVVSCMSTPLLVEEALVAMMQNAKAHINKGHDGKMEIREEPIQTRNFIFPDLGVKMVFFSNNICILQAADGIQKIFVWSSVLLPINKTVSSIQSLVSQKASMVSAKADD
ncbi:hypothetical protein ACJIZ3_016977 [Penstemon smallii]|uniref:Uncharacterized protein n=1 Tax=Penstemon smallii TaxID=265156 RepID=A0ABD3SV13_9LAMI